MCKEERTEDKGTHSGAEKVKETMRYKRQRGKPEGRTKRKERGSRAGLSQSQSQDIFFLVRLWLSKTESSTGWGSNNSAIEQTKGDDGDYGGIVAMGDTRYVCEWKRHDQMNKESRGVKWGPVGTMKEWGREGKRGRESSTLFTTNKHSVRLVMFQSRFSGTWPWYITLFMWQTTAAAVIRCCPAPGM